MIALIRASLATYGSPWHMVLVATFVASSSWSVLVALAEPGLIGSHAVVYTEAARAWLEGGNPWAVGPRMVVFSGPPPMLLPFAPSTLLPPEAVRWGWVVLDALLAVAILRRLRMPAYWLAFPPIIEAIILGHPEIVVLALLVFGRSTISGFAAVIKVYAALPLLAAGRWRALLLGAAVTAVTIPVLPWGTFLANLPAILSNIARQNVGDSVFGDPILLIGGVLALGVLGPRTGLWLAVPLVWPYAQPVYKVITLPMLTPLLAVCWAIPIPGMTLLGVLAMATVRLIELRRPFPNQVRGAIEPVARLLDDEVAVPRWPAAAVARPS